MITPFAGQGPDERRQLQLLEPGVGNLRARLERRFNTTDQLNGLIRPADRGIGDPEAAPPSEAGRPCIISLMIAWAVLPVFYALAILAVIPVLRSARPPAGGGPLAVAKGAMRSAGPARPRIEIGAWRTPRPGPAVYMANHASF
jgi:hypothetical protein